MIFVVLLIVGFRLNEISNRGIAIFVLLWIAGLFSLPLIAPGVPLFPPFVAVLDIALVFVIFKGDLRLR